MTPIVEEHDNNCNAKLNIIMIQIAIIIFLSNVKKDLKRLTIIF